MNKTLAERAEEARIILEAENKVKWESKRLEAAKDAIEYFKIHLPEAKYAGDGKFKFDGELFDWQQQFTLLTGLLDSYELIDYRFGRFSNLGEYGAYLKRKREREEWMNRMRPEWPPNRIETEEGPFEPIIKLFKSFFK